MLNRNLSCPLLLIWDFNEVLQLEERKHAINLTSTMKAFGDLVQDLNLLDVKINN